jgi:hypothetical protein
MTVEVAATIEVKSSALGLFKETRREEEAKTLKLSAGVTKLFFQ